MNEYDGFEEIKKIYDSLPEEQKKLIAPRGRFVNSPFVAERVLSENKDGFAEAYDFGDNKGFVTIGVKPDSQGKGVGKEVLSALIQQARENGKLKELVYKIAKDNEASKGLISKFVNEPYKTTDEDLEYRIKLK